MKRLVAKLVAIEKDRVLSYEETEQLIDVTEQIIERPSKKQKDSGKKRRHTLKTKTLPRQGS
ncbi:hypothetical protein [Candidatus Sarmatiella mevalonica]|uniref:hypothetical protein n=1 Tax=Candidatus Sarmatiella mevalonica TaxID=2770581 RepID=UPI001922437B|nr:hypothetical protein [Candidatus Sarmatiella mevalonica]